MKSEDWFLLYHLFNMGGHKRRVVIGTEELGKMMGTSQQTASRRLLSLLREGYIERELVMRGQSIVITEKGLSALREIYEGLRCGFEEGRNIIFLSGSVFTGFGEGAYYVSKSGYSDQFEEKLGFKPYPGTLNLRLRSIDDIRTRKELENLPGIIIRGFVNGERTYGDVKCYRAKINESMDGALLLIHRTHYGQDVVEVIAKESVRKKLGLRDGDLVQLKVLV
ncbi:MAG: DUF120 domain-containing protein [Candidatus Methanomethylicaceae archaeon]